MKVTVYRPTDLGPAELDAWRGWQREDARLANPFLAPEFAVAVGRHLPRARVAVLEDAGALSGFFPFEAHPRSVGRALAYDLADYQALICRPGLRWDPRELLAACGLGVWEFDGLVAHQAAAFAPRHATFAASPFIDLAGGWQAWLTRRKAASQSRIKKVLQKRRKLERELGDLRFTFESTADEDLRRLMSWKSAQYVRTGRADRFAMPWLRSMIGELFADRTDHFSLQLSRLDAGGRCVALYLSLRANGMLAGWFPAYDVDVAEHSPGMACVLELISAGADAGLSRLDLGEGAAPYKESLKDGDLEVAQGWCERPGIAAVARRVQQAPRRAALRVVLGSPALRVIARRTLARVGRARAQLKSVR